MPLNVQAGLARNQKFQDRVFAALVNAAIAIMNETVNEVQTVHVSSVLPPTGGAFTLTGLPGTSLTLTGTLANAANTVTALPSTAGLAVGMQVSGTNVGANATIATITSATALTLSVNSTATGAQSLTFSSGGVVSVPWNCTAAQFQILLGQLANVGATNVICTGGPLPNTDIAVTFQGNLGNVPLGLIAVGVNSLSGGTSPVPSVSRTTAGVAVAFTAARKSQAKAILTGGMDVFRYSLAVAGNATVQGDFDATTYEAAGGVSEATISSDVAFTVNTNWNAFN